MANAAIPIQLAHIPTHTGMVIPYIAFRHADDTPEFGQIDHLRVAECITERRCQLCAQPLTGAAVLMARPQDFSLGYVNEPAQHPWCSGYANRACPMLSGRLPRHRDRLRPQRRQCTVPASCWCGQPAAPPSVDAVIRSGRAATPWYSVRFPMDEYEVKMTARKGPRGISLALARWKIRLVSWGEPDWTDLGRVILHGLPQPEAGSSS